MKYNPLVNLNECEAAGLDPEKVGSIARRLNKAAKEAAALGIVIFGGSGSGTLRYHDGKGGALIVAVLPEGVWDGGDGSERDGGDGLKRAEDFS